MYISVFAVSSLLTLTLAGQLDKRQDAGAIASSLSSLSALLVPPPSIAAELTGVPPEVQAAATNSAALASLEAQFATSIPSWFQALPADAKSYVLGAGAVAASVLPQISSLQTAAVAAGITGAPTGSGGNTTTTTTSSGSSSSSSTTSSTGSGTHGGAGSTSSSSVSHGGAAPTGPIAAGAAFAMGFAGLVMAL